MKSEHVDMTNEYNIRNYILQYEGTKFNTFVYSSFCLFVTDFLSHSRIFHSFRDIKAVFRF